MVTKSHAVERTIDADGLRCGAAAPPS
jgi:hypothetical protein